MSRANGKGDSGDPGAAGVEMQTMTQCYCKFFYTSLVMFCGVWNYCKRFFEISISSCMESWHKVGLVFMSSLERSWVLILDRSLVDDRKGIRSKNAHCSRKSPN